MHLYRHRNFPIEAFEYCLLGQRVTVDLNWNFGACNNLWFRSVSDSVYEAQERQPSNRRRNPSVSELLGREHFWPHSDVTTVTEPAVELRGSGQLTPQQLASSPVSPAELPYRSEVPHHEARRDHVSQQAQVSEIDGFPRTQSNLERFPLQRYAQRNASSIPMVGNNRQHRQDVDSGYSSVNQQAPLEQLNDFRGVREAIISPQGNWSQPGLQAALSTDPNDTIRREVHEHLRHVDEEARRSLYEGTAKSKYFPPSEARSLRQACLQGTTTTSLTHQTLRRTSARTTARITSRNNSLPLPETTSAIPHDGRQRAGEGSDPVITRPSAPFTPRAGGRGHQGLSTSRTPANLSELIRSQRSPSVAAPSTISGLVRSERRQWAQDIDIQRTNSPAWSVGQQSSVTDLGRRVVADDSDE
jgi:hypothetical protein